MSTMTSVYKNKNVSSSAINFPVMNIQESNFVNSMKSIDTNSNSETCGQWDSNIVDILDRESVCTQHCEGETEATLKTGFNEYLDSCSGNTISNSRELFKIRYNNSAPTYVPDVTKSTSNVLLNISNNNCIQNSNLYKPSFNCSGNFGNHCPIKLQKQQNTMLVNISNSFSETTPEEVSWGSACTRTANCSGSTPYCTSKCSSVMCKNTHEKRERPINVQILTKNQNISESVWNSLINSRKDTKYYIENTHHKNETISNQEIVLHSSNSNLSQLITPGNPSHTCSTWKPFPQLQFGQTKCNQILQGNPSTITLQKKKLQVMPCHIKLNDISPNGKINHNRSLPVDTGSTKAKDLFCNVKCSSPVSGGDLLFTNDDSVNEFKKNDKDHIASNEMAQSYSISEMVDHHKDIKKTFPFFSVVHKKLKWSCSLCGESLATRLSLTTHIKSHLLPWCRICLKILNSNEQLVNHMEKKHPSLDTEVDQPGTQFVTSKYGRRRRVYSPATLLQKRRFDLKK